MGIKSLGRRSKIEAGLLFFLKFSALATISYAFLSMSVAPLPSTCVSCHSAEHVSHRSGVHANVSCHACHAGASTAERLDFRISYSRMIASAAFQRQPETALVANDDCTACHAEDILKPFISRTGIRMSHAEKTEAGYSCTDCHSDTGHTLAGGTTRRVDMFECLGCHGAPGAARCETCHAGERQTERRPYASVWRITHGENWERLHGMGGLDTCGACHQPSYCVKCHGIEMPHPDDFRYLHGARALATEETGACYTCHDEAGFCRACHQIEMPHPPGFLGLHAEQSVDDEPTCLRCHDRAECLSCHVEHTHPGIAPGNLRLLRERLGLE